MRKNSEKITVLMLTLLGTYGRDTTQYLYTLVVTHPKAFCFACFVACAYLIIFSERK